MRHPVLAMLNFLEENKIPYYLLRPISLRDPNIDIDVIIPQEDLKHLLFLLKNKPEVVWVNKYIANHTLQVQVGEVLLDVKTRVCFLPTKSLCFAESPPFATYRITKDGWVFPAVAPEYLFTFWTIHFFLDKNRVQDSSTFQKYLEHFRGVGEKLLTHPFFCHWVVLIFDTQSKEFIALVEILLKHGEEKLPINYQRQVKKWWSQCHPIKHIMYYPQKWKYGFYRRLGLSTFSALASVEN